MASPSTKTVTSSPSELRALCGQLKALEASLAAGELTCGELDAALAPFTSSGGPSPADPIARIRAAYIDRLAPAHAAHTLPLRRSILHHLLADISAALAAPSRVFEGELIEAGGRWRARIGRHTLRPDQILSSRQWGIGVTLPETYYAELETSRVRHMVGRLASDLRDLNLIEARLGEGGRSLSPVQPPGVGHRVERLVLDVLNEEARVARAAPLAEDFLERTDVRLKVDGVKRRKGARLQITLVADEAQREKRRKLPNQQSGITVLSPWAMAHRIFEGRTPVAEVFWASLPQRPARAAGLARVLQHMLINAVEGVPDDPRGPMGRLPGAVRAAIREDVAGAARRAAPGRRRR